MSFIIPEITMKVSFDKKLKKSELVKINESKQVWELLVNIFNKDTFDWCEEFIVLYLNNSNKVVGYFKLSSGGMTSTVVDVRMIYAVGLKCMATCVIVAHNHPSGKITPSDADKQITKKIKEAGEFMDIKLLNHIIVTDENYFSFQDEGLL